MVKNKSATLTVWPCVISFYSYSYSSWYGLISAQVFIDIYTYVNYLTHNKHIRLFIAHLIWVVKQSIVVEKFFDPSFVSRLLTPQTGTVSTGCFLSLAPIPNQIIKGNRKYVLCKILVKESTEDIYYCGKPFYGQWMVLLMQIWWYQLGDSQTHQQHENLIGNKVDNRNRLGLQQVNLIQIALDTD